jgi:hypothetical protein
MSVSNKNVNIKCSTIIYNKEENKFKNKKKSIIKFFKISKKTIKMKRYGEVK